MELVKNELVCGICELPIEQADRGFCGGCSHLAEDFHRACGSRHLLNAKCLIDPDSPQGRLNRAYQSPDVLDALNAIEELRADLDEQLVSRVIGARRHRFTWQQIGDAVGATRQGAFNRFGGMIQRYEQAGVLKKVADDTDLVMDKDQARAMSVQLTASACRRPDGPQSHRSDLVGRALGSVSPGAK